ncbi:major facilitator superfamily protein [Hirsutella rhossiliensis]|uniref:Major facilitator superfamily domain-containing protein n=1 Tax=Hirsutella rhossiliensis TaxID=111463 RepID=A0A9P8SI50_9HYPO|nr:major facilitator superfamily domain-containing protein [Hirsutella rhossiliensis]KAH0963828.1 major facilitator superfamily domain-containing protein [Hirsutella rhossiliensis]
MDEPGRRKPPDDGPDHPPGTVELLSRRKYIQDGQLVLIPEPSDDPDDPLLWPKWRKAWNFALLVAMTLLIFTGLSTQSIFISQLRKDLQATNEDLINSRAVEHTGEALGCILFIPFATKYGRRSVYIVSIAVYVVAAWWFANMTTTQELYITNALKGFAAAINETAVQMSIRDMFFLHRRGSANALYHFALSTAFSLIPMAAGAQATNFGWRASATTQAATMTVLFVFFIFSFEETKFVRETGKKISDDSEKDNNSTVGLVLDSDRALPRKPFPHYLRLQFLTTTDESLWKIFYYPIHSWWLPHIVFTSLVFGTGLMWITIQGSLKSIVFSAPPYNFNPQQLGYLFVASFVGSLFGNLYGGYFVDWIVVWLTKRNGGLYEPEMRLYPLPLPALGMSAGLVVFGVTADRGLHWIFPSIGSALMSFGFGGMASISFTLVVDAYPNIIAQGFVVVAFFRNVLGVIGPAATNPWVKGMGLSGLFITAAFINLAINLLGVPLLIWGKRLRTKTASRYYRLSKQS